MNKAKNNTSAISVFDRVTAKCVQFLDSFAALCGGRGKMKIVLSVAGAGLCALLALSIILFSGGDAKEKILENIPDSVESAYMLEYNSEYDFQDEPSGDILPNRGIIVLYENYNNFYVLVCRPNGKVIEKFDNNTTVENMLNPRYPGEELLYQDDLQFITECMNGCIRVSDGEEKQEINKWYKFSDDEIAG